mgnify:CR=1 FL=1
MTVKAIASLTTLAFLLGNAGVLLATANRPIATGRILQTEGDVQLQRGDGRTFSPEAGTLLYPDDRLLATTGNAAILCEDNSITTVDSDWLNSCPAATEECDPEAYNCPHRGDDLNVGDNAIPYIISPRRTKLLSDRPLLRWNAVDGVTEYTVDLLENGRKLWSIPVSVEPSLVGERIELAYPANENPLEPESWYLLVVKTDTGVRSPSEFEFQLLDRDTVETVRQKQAEIESQPFGDMAKAIAISQLYSDYGLNVEAIDLLESLPEKTSAVYQQLGNLYWENLRLVRQGSQTYLKAIDLANPNNLELTAIAKDRVGQYYLQIGEKREEAIQLLTESQAAYETLGDVENATRIEILLQRTRDNS